MSLPSLPGELLSSRIVLTQLMQEISVSNGLRSSFIDTRGGAVGSAIMALGDAMVLALTTRKCRSCGSGSRPET
ncbi:hypothetical protein [Bradyrhizobium acaciae]|uniref:hypothetical protein n=1 Tax=Bradyrhizobium acaciae TaxID=2683706 RepID=UPI001E3E5024|nr:hypothetical protein [Bradyrhizobium acaciae]MCC8983387.1 hypothetical protein [Bradyrhizobium acaciae]